MPEIPDLHSNFKDMKIIIKKGSHIILTDTLVHGLP